MNEFAFPEIPPSVDSGSSAHAFVEGSNVPAESFSESYVDTPPAPFTETVAPTAGAFTETASETAVDAFKGFDESFDDSEPESAAPIDPVEVETVDAFKGFNESFDDSEPEVVAQIDPVEVEAVDDVPDVDEPVMEVQQPPEREAELFPEVDESKEPALRVADLPEPVDSNDLVETVDSTRPDIETAETEKERQEETELIVQQADLAEQAAEQKQQFQEAMQEQPSAPAEAHGQWLARDLSQTSSEVGYSDPYEHSHTPPTASLDPLLMAALAAALVNKNRGE